MIYDALPTDTPPDLALHKSAPAPAKFHLRRESCLTNGVEVKDAPILLAN